MNLSLLFLKILRKGYRSVWHPYWTQPDCVIDRQKANDLIYDVLISDSPCMISRIGTVEMGCLGHYLNLHDSNTLLKRCMQYIVNDNYAPIWDEKHLDGLCNGPGGFPHTREFFDRFCEQYLHDIPPIDILGSLNITEKYLPIAPETIKIHLESLYPFFVERPWTRALKEKRVLVIHPFEKTILHQEKKREMIFADPDVFPPYRLQTLRAVQSIGMNDELQHYHDWFDALHSMEEKITQYDFDFALIGCGGYGLPLAAFIKRMGKKAIHLGGGLQLLFGIKGKRWEDNYTWTYHTKEKLDLNYTSLYNDFWVRPFPEDTPQVATKIENGCYW